ncbi:Hypothetical predicted protein [Prunus dulcis]|uniref:Uncharacterized protein n=1 Tax=Prunus dulcis TaxID=3755 RepID=A0A5E4GDK2_PRUDU|nr:Hypothetical predicted protein [Prunus dulcis]
MGGVAHVAEAHKGCDGKGMSATWPQLLAGCYGDGWGRRHGKKKKKKKKGIFIIRACLWCKYAERERDGWGWRKRWCGDHRWGVGVVWWWWWLTLGISGDCGTHIFWMGPTSRTSVCSLSLLNLFVSSFEACFD